MEAHALDFDKRPRRGPKIFVGEWATRAGSPTPNMAGALGDAAWMIGMERNSDLVVMTSYAPLFVNVSKVHGRDRSMQWHTDLIGYDALHSYGSPSFYAQVMFSTHHGNEILATDSQDIPTRHWQPRAPRRGGVERPRPPLEHLRQIFFDATRDSKNGTVCLKVVNEPGTPQPVKIEISGATTVASKGTANVLKANRLKDTNSIDEPTNIVPVTEAVEGLGTDFMREFPPYSITVLELKVR